MKRRAESKSSWEKNVFKYLSNNLYGSSLLDRSRFTNIKLVTSEAMFDKVNKKSNLKNLRVLNSHSMLMEFSQMQFLERSLRIVGYMVLDHSKKSLYSFGKTMYESFGDDKIYLLLGDTDSAKILVRNCPEYPQILKKLSADVLDLSGLPKDHDLYNDNHAGQMGYWKLENYFMHSFVGLKSKMYAERYQGENVVDILKAKGVAKHVLKRHLKFDDYVRVLQTQCEITAEYYGIQAKKGELMTLQLKKKILSPFDDKRYHIPQKLDVSLALGSIFCDN